MMTKDTKEKMDFWLSQHPESSAKTMRERIVMV